MTLELENPVTLPEKIGKRLVIEDVRVIYRIVTEEGEEVHRAGMRLSEGQIPDKLESGLEVAAKFDHEQQIIAKQKAIEAKKKAAEEAAKEAARAAKAAEEAAAKAAEAASE